MSCTLPTPPFDIAITIGSAPSYAFTLSDDATGTQVDLNLSGASLWFAVKSLPTDSDASALIFASTQNGIIAITDASAGEFQVDLSETDTAATATFSAGNVYYAYVKVQLGSGETRVRSGMATMFPEGVQAPS